MIDEALPDRRSQRWRDDDTLGGMRGLNDDIGRNHLDALAQGQRILAKRLMSADLQRINAIGGQGNS